MKKLMCAVMMVSTAVLAAPPAPVAPAPRPGAAKSEAREERRGERREEREHRLRLLAVLGIADALELTDAEALKLPDKLKVFDERRRPIREQAFESMKTLRAAADGEAGSLTQVDQALQKVLDGRGQLATIDKEMFNALAVGQTPQKKAKLALFMAKFGQQLQKLKALGGEHEGRRGKHRRAE